MNYLEFSEKSSDLLVFLKKWEIRTFLCCEENWTWRLNVPFPYWFSRECRRPSQFPFSSNKLATYFQQFSFRRETLEPEKASYFFFSCDWWPCIRLHDMFHGALSGICAYVGVFLVHVLLFIGLFLPLFAHEAARPVYPRRVGSTSPSYFTVWQVLEKLTSPSEMQICFNISNLMNDDCGGVTKYV